MELHVAKQPGAKAGPDALVRAIKRGQAILSRMVATETYLDGATAYAAPSRPLVPHANIAMDLRIPPGSSAERVLNLLDAHFATHSVLCNRFESSEQVWPPALVAALQARGFHAVNQEVYLLSHYVPPVADPLVQIIPGRAAYGELQSLIAVHGRSSPANNHEAADQIAQAVMDQLDDPRIDVFLGRRERKPVGAASLLTLGNIGVVLDLFAVHPGIAPEPDPVIATLATRLFDHCLRAQFEQVIIALPEGDPSLGRLLALGFKSVAGYVSLVRRPA